MRQDQTEPQHSYEGIQYQIRRDPTLNECSHDGCLRSGHSVTTWFASVGPDLFVPTSMISGPKEPSERSWVSHVREDSRVRIRLGDLVYERMAKKVDGDICAQLF